MGAVDRTKAIERGDGTPAPDGRRLHLVADPGLAAEIVEELQEELGHSLATGAGTGADDAPRWRVTVASRRLDVDERAGDRLSEALVRELSQEDGGVVIVLTDQPRRAGTQLVVADADAVHRVALVSLPGLGGLGLAGRVRETVLELTRELSSRNGTQPVVATLRGARRVAPSGEGEDRHVRFVGVGARSLFRLLTGMVRANRPWRLIPQLSGAFAGALATGAYVVVNASIWRLSDTAGPLRLSMVTLFAFTAMVVWLIVKHRLWERPVDREARWLAVIYNVATVITLTVGVLVLYVGLFLLCVVGEALLLRRDIVEEALRHSVRWTDYAAIAWLASSLATIGGAIGSGLDSEDAARDAAFGYRQRARDSNRRETG